MRRDTAVHPAARPDEMPTGEKHRERREVVTYAVGNSGAPDGHEACTRAEIARRLAAVAGFDYAGEYDPGVRYDARPYFVPSAHVDACRRCQPAHRRAPAICSAAWCPPRSSPRRRSPIHWSTTGHLAPRGWSTEFPRQVADSVLPGFQRVHRGGRAARRAGCCSNGRGAGQARHRHRRSRTVGRRRRRRARTRRSPRSTTTTCEAGVVVEQNLSDGHDAQRGPGPRRRRDGLLLRHAAPDQEQLAGRGLRRLATARRARRLRHAAGARPAGGRAARDRPGAHLRSMPRRRASPDSLRPVATTTSRRA